MVLLQRPAFGSAGGPGASGSAGGPGTSGSAGGVGMSGMSQMGLDGGGRGLPALDPTQLAAVRHRGGPAVVLGAPGTGKTTVALAAVLGRIAEGVEPDACLVIASSRVAAATLRERISAAVGRTATEPAARTASSLAFGLLRRQAVLEGLAPPKLLSGPEQDVILRELLAGHAAGTAPAPAWPAGLEAALLTRGFRGELRDLLMRAAERGLAPGDLAALGRTHGRPEWVAAARVAAEYEEVTALARPGGLDPAALLAVAADALEADDHLLGEALPGLRAVVVDDAQELTPPGARLVAALARGGADLLVIGDPDVGTQSFRGGDPRLCLEVAAGGATYVLGRRWRQPQALAAVSARVTERIGAIGSVAHRSAAPGPDPGSDVDAGRGQPEGRQGREAARVVLARSPAQEARHVAEELRRAHLVGGVPWSQMAVIVRGRGLLATLRRVLTGSGVPVVVTGAQVPLRDEPVVAALLGLFRICLAAAVATDRARGEATDRARGEATDRARGEATDRPLDKAPDSPTHGSLAARSDAGSGTATGTGVGGSAGLVTAPLEAGILVDLLTSPLGGLDAVGVRRLRRALRAEERGRGSGRSVDEALVAGILGDGTLDRLGTEAAAARRLARAIGAGQAAAVIEGGRWGPEVTAESVLWALWSALGVAEPWRRAALEGRPGAPDRELDAVVALFGSAATYVDRLPGRGPDGFLDHVAGQDVAGDQLAETAPVGEAVTLTTPAGAAGREWDVVAICGVQEGAWPDLRLRGSVLGSQRLVDVCSGRAAGPREALAAVRNDETRLFLVAVSRARRRLLVTATANEDDQPSPFLDLVDPGAGQERPVTPVVETMSPPGLVARLRRELAGTRDPARAAALARRLALLAAEGISGADPAHWWALQPPSDDRPRRAEEVPVRVSPSRVETFGNCELRWLLGAAGGDRPRAGGADAVGSLVHAIVAEVDNADADAMQEELDRRWPSLGLPPGWLSDRGRQQAREMLARVARYDAEARAGGWEVVGREVAAAAVAGRADVRGRMDRVERGPDGRLRVIDLKTGSSKPRADELARHPQLGAYQVMIESGAVAEPDVQDAQEPPADAASGSTPTRDAPAAQAPPADAADSPSRSAGAALLQVGKASAATKVDLQVQGPLAADDDPAWAERMLTETAAGMAGANFTARVGDWCRMCSGRSCCPLSGDGEPI